MKTGTRIETIDRLICHDCGTDWDLIDCIEHNYDICESNPIVLCEKCLEKREEKEEEEEGE